MSKKSTSNLPNGGYSLTNGSNYMLDGFQYDTEYNNGVLEKARLPEAKGLAQLPSGMIPMESNLFSEIPASENLLDLTSFTKEAGFQSINLVDHSWLAQESKLHNETKMKNKESLKQYLDQGKLEDSAIDELEDLWGNSTDGLNLVPNTNRQHQPYENIWEAPMSNYGGDQYKKIQNQAWVQEKIEAAMRKSAYGQPIKQVLASLKEELGDHADAHADAFQRIASEHGLHGKVFIREEAFPGLFNGKWSNHIHKRCASVQYIIPKKADCAYDRYMGCAVVSEASLPWKQAYESYIPKLRTAGVKVASTGSYQERLKKAFLSKAMELSIPQTWFVTVDTDAQNSRQLKQAKAVVEVVPTAQERELARGEARLARIASEVIQGGFLSEAQVEGVLAGEGEAQDKVAQLYKLASQPKKTASYAGLGKDVYIHTPTKKVIEAPKMTRQASLDKKAGQEAMLQIDKYVKSGLISMAKVQKIACGCQGNPQMLLDLINESLSRVDSQDYSGPAMFAHVMTASSGEAEVSEKEMAVREKKASQKVQQLVRQGLISEERAEAIFEKKAHLLPEERIDAVLREIAKPKKTASYQGQQYSAHVSAKEVVSEQEDPTWKKMASWIRTQMSEGMMGRSLDTMIETRFSSELLDAHGSRIASLRAKHEGLSGQLYVDAQVYGMKKEGCDAGAGQHRANTIPAVLAFEKCEGCVYKNANSVCQKYNKPVVTKVAELIEDVKQYQKESIRLANASDSEKTASLFNNYDASEYSLTADEGVIDFSEVESEAPSKLASVLFGGYEMED